MKRNNGMAEIGLIFVIFTFLFAVIIPILKHSFETQYYQIVINREMMNAEEKVLEIISHANIESLSEGRIEMTGNSEVFIHGFDENGYLIVDYLIYYTSPFTKITKELLINTKFDVFLKQIID